MSRDARDVPSDEPDDLHHRPCSASRKVTMRRRLAAMAVLTTALAMTPAISVPASASVPVSASLSVPVQRVSAEVREEALRVPVKAEPDGSTVTLDATEIGRAHV